MFLEHVITTAPAEPVVNISIARYPGDDQVLLGHTYTEFSLGFLMLEDRRTAVLWLPRISRSKEQLSTARVQIFPDEDEGIAFCGRRILEWPTETMGRIVVSEQGKVVPDSPFYRLVGKPVNSSFRQFDREMALLRAVASGFYMPIDAIARKMLAGS